MFVAVARLTLSIPEAGSLKSKRHVLHKVIDKVKARFNVSIAEVADNDLWQRATLGISAVANEHAFAQETVSKVVRFIEELYVAPVTSCTTEVIPMGDELYGEDDGTTYGAAARGVGRTLAEAEAEAEAGEAAADEPPQDGPPRRGRYGQRALNDDERERAIEELRQRLREGRRATLEEDDEG